MRDDFEIGVTAQAAKTTQLRDINSGKKTYSPWVPTFSYYSTFQLLKNFCSSVSLLCQRETFIWIMVKRWVKISTGKNKGFENFFYLQMNIFSIVMTWKERMRGEDTWR